ncbi:unnamed protein product [Gemmataceae bacterium]|nr:unnamed protein product [Gemmataceae bacterium]VTU00183.1 unnamed protein product [Gemmataceae bacterium]
MNERLLMEEWYATRRRALQMFPVALVLFVAVCAVVYLEDLYRSEFGFLVGALVGMHAYWAALEALTVIQVGRLLRRAGGAGAGANAARTSASSS